MPPGNPGKRQQRHVYFVKDMPKKKLQLSTEIAHLPKNKTKNRYRDILPCK
jgi:hypothetical protein